MPWIVPVASAVIGAAGSMFAANKNSQSAKNLQRGQQPLIDAQTGLVKAMTPYATGFYDRAQRAYDPAFNYYHSLASGNRGDLVSALAPEISGINQRYASADRTTSELMPRGGATTAFLAEQPYRRASEIQALMSGGRANAMGALANLSQTAGSLGAGAAGTSIAAASGAGGMMQGQFNTQQLVNAQNAELYNKIAQSLMGLIHTDPQGNPYIGNQPGRG